MYIIWGVSYEVLKVFNVDFAVNMFHCLFIQIYICLVVYLEQFIKDISREYEIMET